MTVVVADLHNIVRGWVGLVVVVMVAARGGVAHDDGVDAVVKVVARGEAEVDEEEIFATAVFDGIVAVAPVVVGVKS